MGRFGGLFLITAAVLLLSREASGKVKPTALPQTRPDYLAAAITTATKSVFTRKEELLLFAIPFIIRYEDDPTTAWGEVKIKQTGRPGSRRRTYDMAYWYDQETSRQLLKDEVLQPPQDEIIKQGTKKTTRTGSFDRCGEIVYVGKMRVWATSYDKYCSGCLGVTYTGLPAGYGTVAVDPQIIPLYSRLCIPGYGLAVAGDIGGAVKGNTVDLGFDDVRSGWWRAQWTDIYLLP